MKTRWMLLGMLAGILLFGRVNLSHAVTVDYTNIYDSGLNLWTYAMDVTNDTPDLLYDLVIYPTAQPLSVADRSAVGWGTGDLGNFVPYFVHWEAEFGSEILTGDTLGGFWFTYSGSGAGDIGSLAYAVTLWDGLNDGPYTVGAVTQTRVAVPEPGTLLLLGSSLAGLALWRRNRYRLATEKAERRSLNLP